MAGVTFREAARKKVLWAALGAGALFLGVFAAGLHYQVQDFQTRTIVPFVRYQILNAMLMIGLYAVDLLAVVMTIFTSVDTISGEVTSGTIQAIATKPLARWEVLVGKWAGFAAMVASYVALMFTGTIAVGYWLGSVVPRHALTGGSLVLLECLLSLTITILCGTWWSTLTNGVFVLGLHGFAFMGGWLEQMSGFTESSRLALIGIVSSLIMPSEAIWRRAAHEMQSPLAGSLPFSPFADVSIPSGTMIAYAVLYLVVALAAAVVQFERRDL
jgi:ABC-type transport system involved in multi-copper enzyme maturation permease subunit